MNNKVILKFPLSIVARQMVPMPEGATILRIESQRDIPTIWALCPADYETQDKEMRHICMYATGQLIEARQAPVSLKYIGTSVVYGDSFVWHFFEELSNA